MYRYFGAAFVAALLAACGGGMSSTPTALAPNSMNQADHSTTAPDANGCFRFNRFIREEDLRSGVKWRLHPDMRPDKFVGIAFARNGLRDVTIKIRPYNNPEDVVILNPGGNIRGVAFTRPTFEIVVLEKNPMNDRGPGAQVNAVVCKE